MTSNLNSNSYIGSSYIMRAINQEIKLWEGELTLEGSDFKVIGMGYIYLAWIVTPSLSFRIDTNSWEDILNVYHSTDEYVSIKFQENGMDKTIHGCFVTNGNCDTGVIRGIINEEVTLESSNFLSSTTSQATSVIYGICNFTHKNLYNSKREQKGCLKDPVSYKTNDKLIYSNVGRLVLEFDEYTWIIDESPENSNLKKELLKTGGYAITHYAKLYNQSGDISRRDALFYAEALSLFLSFIQGHWISLILPVGYDKNEDILWKQLKQPSRITPYNSFLICTHDLSDLNKMYHEFIKKLHDSNWEYSIKQAVVWYVDSISTTSNVEGIIVWIYSAIELLAYNYIVKHNNQLAESKFNKKSIYTLVQELDISVDINKYFPSIKERKDRYINTEIRSEIEEGITEEGIFILSKARNDVVHPEKKVGFTTDSRQVKYEMLDIGRWYLEMILIRLLGNKNFESDRLRQWEGD
jgi:hypothetical protein